MASKPFALIYSLSTHLISHLLYELTFICFHSSSRIAIKISSANSFPFQIASRNTPSRLKPADWYAFSAEGLNENTSNSKR